MDLQLVQTVHRAWSIIIAAVSAIIGLFFLSIFVLYLAKERARRRGWIERV